MMMTSKLAAAVDLRPAGRRLPSGPGVWARGRRGGRYGGARH
jgi:hypothetical protein